MKLYLASHDRRGFPADLGRLVGTNRRVAVIANANDGELASDRNAGIEAEIASLARLDLAGFEFDLRDYFGPNGSLTDDLSDFGLVWAPGGNAFLLNRAIRDSGLGEVLPRLLQDTGLAYGGYSAGAVVAGPSLRGFELVDESLQLPPPYVGPIAWDGLGLVPYSIVPHHGSRSEMGDRTERVVEYLSEHRMRFRTLADLQSIVIDGCGERLLDQRSDSAKPAIPTSPAGDSSGDDTS